MTLELITVIIPIYNTKPYLDRCISSVINQTYKNLEIILINDGSTDGSGNLCDQWAKKDSRIHVLHKANSGQGMARNTGIENAHGNYIYFLDSDDYIDLHTLELAYTNIKKNNSDIVLFGFSHVNPEGNITQTITPNCKQTEFVGKDVQHLFLPRLLSSKETNENCWNLNASVCMALFSMELIRRSNCHFVSEREIISEDTYFLLMLFKHVNRVSVLREALYFYFENSSSFSRAFRKDRFEKILSFYQSSKKLCFELGYTSEVISRLTSLTFGFSIGAMKQLVHSNESLSFKLTEMKRIVCHSIWHEQVFKSAIANEGFQRKILLWCILHRLVLPCYILSRLKK